MGRFRRWPLVCALFAQVGCAPWTLGQGPSSASKPIASVATPAADAQAAPIAEASKLPPHPVIEAYVAGLESILSEPEKAELRAISLDGTYVGDAQRLRYLAADRAVRTFLPETLEATRNPELIEHARKIRALPPLMNPDTDAVAYEVVSAALAAQERIDRERDALRFGAVPPKGSDARDAAVSNLTPVSNLEPPQDPSSAFPEVSAVSAIHEVDADARTQYAEALAAYSEAYAAVFGVSKLHADSAATAAADASDAAQLLTEAIARGADRQLLVQAGMSLVQQMADAARRREKVPLPKLTPEKKPTEP